MTNDEEKLKLLSDISIPTFNSLENEVEFWKNLALEFKRKYEELLKQMGGDKISLSTEVERKEDPVDETQPTMDPFECLHEDLHESILQHFTGKDLLVMTEVSPSWAAIANNHHNLSNKTQFKWHFPTLQNCKDDFTIAKETHRIYRSINAKYNYRSPKGIWFSVIEKHFDSLEELILDFRDPPCELITKSYPKLKHLSLPDVNVDIMKWLEVTEIRNLESLVLHKCNNGSVEMKQLLKFIQRQVRLKSLNIYPFLGFIDFYEDHADNFNHHNFKLDHLTTEGNYFSTLKFLTAQKDNLKSIEILEVYSETMLRSLIQDFSCLETLTVQLLLDENDEIFKNGFDNINIGTNTKITSIGVGFVYEISHAASKALLSTCPNARTIKFIGSDDPEITTKALTCELIEWIAKKFQKLERIYYKSIEDSGLHFYKEIKSNENINSNIKFLEIVKKV